jgi:hypothetical protein
MCATRAPIAGFEHVGIIAAGGPHQHGEVITRLNVDRINLCVRPFSRYQLT